MAHRRTLRAEVHFPRTLSEHLRQGVGPILLFRLRPCLLLARRRSVRGTIKIDQAFILSLEISERHLRLLALEFLLLGLLHLLISLHFVKVPRLLLYLRPQLSQVLSHSRRHFMVLASIQIRVNERLCLIFALICQVLLLKESFLHRVRAHVHKLVVPARVPFLPQERVPEVVRGRRVHQFVMVWNYLVLQESSRNGLVV